MHLGLFRVVGGGGGLLIDSVDSTSIKHLLDAVDRVICRTNNLGSQEWDFIINYDIKCRPGADEPED